MSRGKELIAYFMCNTSYRLNKTEVVKMCYFFEYIHELTFGESYTEFDFIRYNYGPYCNTIDRVLTDMEEQQEIIHETIGYEEKIINKYRGVNLNPSIGCDQSNIANYVISALAGLSYTAMIDKIYSTPPMLSILKLEREQGIQKIGSELDMKKSKALFKPSKEQLRAAHEVQNKIVPSGSDEEYSKCLINEYKENEYLRVRAMICH